MAKISASMVDMLNAQLGRELVASNQYLAMAIHLDGRSLDHLAGFYFHQADEERAHALKLMRYLLDVGATPVVPDLAAPKKDFESLTEIVTTALRYEESVTAAIHEIVHAAGAEHDYATVQFLQWFVAEQIEEESMAGKLVDIVDMSQNELQVEEYVRYMAAADPAAPEA